MLTSVMASTFTKIITLNFPTLWPHKQLIHTTDIPDKDMQHTPINLGGPADKNPND